MRTNGVQAYVEGCLNVMGQLGMLDREIPPCRIEHVVEDPRPGSGHMQICNPSPITGFFEPRVQVGDVVQQGQSLGTVCDPLGNDIRDIRSETDGLLVVLRTFPRVRQGETLGVVVEIPREPESRKMHEYH
jgi:predicted deacylase